MSAIYCNGAQFSRSLSVRTGQGGVTAAWSAAICSETPEMQRRGMKCVSEYKCFGRRSPTVLSSQRTFSRAAEHMLTKARSVVF